ncbi:ESPR-type extended signal peptide-containing protein, partial [Variovorax sp. JS1663]|uniref:ESPR-type extended signal peptide-containing protein n=1 Tax=Variovorax sp. JS1663 TaxID=1851577 RepID=UPI002352F229
MNKSYRTVWNEALGAWVAASEITKARGKGSRSAKLAVAAVTVCVAMGGVPDAFAQQLGSGQAANDLNSTAISPDKCFAPARAGQFAVAVGCDVKANMGTSWVVDIGRGPEDVVGTGKANFAFGLGTAVATGAGATNIVIGNNASATASSTQPLTTGDQIAIGSNVRVIGQDSTALGSDLRVFSGTSIAIGNNSGGILDDKSGGSIAIGVSSLVNNNSDNAAVFGFRAKISFAKSSTAIGSSASVVGIDDLNSAAFGTAVGSGASVTAQNSTAVGAFSRVDVQNGTALGLGASVTTADSVALGANTTTSAAVATANGTIAGVPYTYAGGTPAGVVSVGNATVRRQITNLAAGQVSKLSTDGINGSQLFAVQEYIQDGVIKYDVNGGVIDNKNVTLAGTGGTKITNVAPGTLSTTSTDAVNGSQLDATNTNVT